MSNMIRFSALVLLSVLLVGCASTITNLTPSKQPRNATGLYPIEAAWDTRQQTVRPSSLQPYVVAGFESYPMRPTAGVKNRWETLIPVAPNVNTVPYHIRFDYKYNTFGKPKESSRLSPGYELQIIDR